MSSVKVSFVLVAMMIASSVIAAPKKKVKPLPLGGVTFGMTTKDFLALAKKKRRKLIGPGKGLISHEEMLSVQEYVTDKDRQIVSISGAKTQTIMILNDKLVAVKLLFTSSASLKNYLKIFEKMEFTKTGENYEGTIPEGEFVGRKVKVLVTTVTIKRRKKYTVTASCIEVFGKGVTVDKINAAMKKGGGGANRSEKPEGKNGMGGVL